MNGRACSCQVRAGYYTIAGFFGREGNHDWQGVVNIDGTILKEKVKPSPFPAFRECTAIRTCAETQTIMLL